jgi:putative cell wall-binding protein
MTERETVLLKEFKDRLDKLIELCERLKYENHQLIDAKLRLEEQVHLLNKENEVLDKKNEDLKLAKSLMATDENSHNAKIRINRIVREIDNCIALINK